MNNSIRYQNNQKFTFTIYYKFSQNDEFDLVQSIWQNPLIGVI